MYKLKRLDTRQSHELDAQTAQKISEAQLSIFSKLQQKIMAVRSCAQNSEYVSKILSERRKAKKPLMEKLRRARINESLNELKSLVLDALNKDVSRYSKMEKADILEMTVQYMRDLKREECKLQGLNKTAEYRAGFNHCAAEISRNLTSVNGADQLRSKMLSYLAQSCVQGNSQETPVSTIGATSSILPPETTSLCTTTTLAPVWVPYPSPPPSPVYGSPLESPSQSPRSPLECASFNSSSTVASMLNHENNKSINHSNTKKAHVWRPWEKHTVAC